MALKAMAKTDFANQYGWWVFWLAVFGLFTPPALAQSVESHYQTRGDSAGGYWMVHTHPDSRNTQINFFNPQHQLLYTQTLTGRYIKFSKRNQRVLDSTLHRLVSGQLLTTQLKTHNLPEDRLVRRQSNQEAALSVEAETLTDAGKQPRVNLSLSTKGRLAIDLINPQQVPVLILLQQQDQKYIYREQTQQPRFSRLINVVQIPDEWFYLIIREPLQEHKYQVMAPTAWTPYRLELVRTVKRRSVRSAVPLRPTHCSLKTMAGQHNGLF